MKKKVTSLDFPVKSMYTEADWSLFCHFDRHEKSVEAYIRL